MKTHRQYYLCFVLMFAALLATAQTIPEPPRTMLWDGTHGVVAFGHGIVRPGNLPIRTYSNGVKRGGDIDLFRDFPNLKDAGIDDIAAGPNGTTIISGLLQDKDKHYRQVILTYDESGKLIKVWDVVPYNPNAIAVDDQDGSVYMLGDRADQKTAGPAYPLLIHYSQDGRVIGQGLPANTFAKKSLAVLTGDIGDSPVMTLRNGRLFIYAAGGREIVVCTTDGKVIRQLQLDPILKNLAVGDHLQYIELRSLAFLGNNHAVMNLMEADSDRKPILGTTRLLNLSTGAVKTLQSGKNGRPFITTKGTDVIYLQSDGNQLSMQAQTTGVTE